MGPLIDRQDEATEILEKVKAVEVGTQTDFRREKNGEMFFPGPSKGQMVALQGVNSPSLRV